MADYGAPGHDGHDDAVVESPSGWSFRASQENGGTVSCVGCGDDLDDDLPIVNDADGFARHEGCQDEPDPTVPDWPAHDLSPCVANGEHLRSQRHPHADCLLGAERDDDEPEPTYVPGLSVRLSFPGAPPVSWSCEPADLGRMVLDALAVDGSPIGRTAD